MDGARGFLGVVAGVAVGTVFAWLILALAAMGAMGSMWGSFVHFGVVGNLQDARHAVEQADVAPADRDRLVQRLTDVRARMQRGDLEIGFTAWIAHDDVFEDALEDGVLTPTEVSQMDAERDLLEAM